jgi:molecular chaperone GrpE
MPKKILKTKPEVIDYQGKYQRALADYQNLEKRIVAEKATFVNFATATLIRKLLTIVDNLGRAVTHSKDKGLAMIHKQFLEILETEGVMPILAKGQKFDPNSMEAVEQVIGKPKNIVTDEVAPGYMLNDKVLRTAKVRVGK